MKRNLSKELKEKVHTRATTLLDTSRIVCEIAESTEFRHLETSKTPNLPYHHI